MAGTEDGTSSPLTVDSAIPAIESLLSAQEDQQSTEPQPKPKPAPKVEEEHEATEERPEHTEQQTDADESDEQDESEEQRSEPPRRKVKVDGEEVEVTEDELLKGYSRTADYTRKTQALAEKAKAFEAEQAAVRAERQKYATSLTQLEQALKQFGPAEPDWDNLRQTAEPAVFAAAWASWDQHQKQLAAVRAEAERAQAAVAQDQQAKLRATVEAERGKLRELIPEWKDATVEKSEKAKLVEYAKSLGFSDDELSQVYDSRPLVLLRKAMLFDEAQKATPTVRERIEKVKAATPGSATSRQPVTQQTKARQRLAKTGKAEDAAAAIEMMLDD